MASSCASGRRSGCLPRRLYGGSLDVRPGLGTPQAFIGEEGTRCLDGQNLRPVRRASVDLDQASKKAKAATVVATVTASYAGYWRLWGPQLQVKQVAVKAS